MLQLGQANRFISDEEAIRFIGDISAALACPNKMNTSAFCPAACAPLCVR